MCRKDHIIGCVRCKGHIRGISGWGIIISGLVKRISEVGIRSVDHIRGIIRCSISRGSIVIRIWGVL